MQNTFLHNQKGGVSPQFAIIICAIFLTIGGALYFQGETVYGLFDNMMNEIKYITKA